MLKSCLALLLACAVAAFLIWKALQEAPTEPATPSSASAHSSAAFTPEVKKELQTLQKQFQSPEDYQSRLAAQNLDEAALRQHISTALAEQQKLEKQLTQVNEATAYQWFKDHAEELRIPRAYHAAHLYLSSHVKEKPDREAEIRELHRRLVTGEANFTQLVEKHSEDERTQKLRGDLGWFSATRMPMEIITTLDRMRPGQISEPVQSPLGWHLLQLIEARESRLPTFDEVRAEILAALDLPQRLQQLQNIPNKPSTTQEEPR
jgi:peptidyl-prolyl cis-trans isomerase C